jgi:hypothetical protein
LSAATEGHFCFGTLETGDPASICSKTNETEEDFLEYWVNLARQMIFAHGKPLLTNFYS